MIVKVVPVSGSQVHGTDNDVGHGKPLINGHILYKMVVFNDIDAKHLHAKPLANFDHLITDIANPDHEQSLVFTFPTGEAVPVEACKIL